LKGALTPHIKDYSLEVKYEDDSVDRVSESLRTSLRFDDNETKPDKGADPNEKPISLYDPAATDEHPKTDEPNDIFAGLPKLDRPHILQTPHKILALYPFNRSYVYLLLSPKTSHLKPKSVTLRGTSPQGPSELEIPVEILQKPDNMIHQLAARKATQELEEARGWVSDAITDAEGGSVKTTRPAQFALLQRREAVRLGVEFQVGGKYCSFVAVEANEAEIAEKRRKALDTVTDRTIERDDDDDWVDLGKSTKLLSGTSSHLGKNFSGHFVGRLGYNICESNVSDDSDEETAPARFLRCMDSSSDSDDDVLRPEGLGTVPSGTPENDADLSGAIGMNPTSSIVSGGASTRPNRKLVSFFGSAPDPVVLGEKRGLKAVQTSQKIPDTQERSEDSLTTTFDLIRRRNFADKSLPLADDEDEESDDEMGFGLFDGPNEPPSPRIMANMEVDMKRVKKKKNAKALTLAPASKDPRTLLQHLIDGQAFDGSWPKIEDLPCDKLDLKVDDAYSAATQLNSNTKEAVNGVFEMLICTIIVILYLEKKMADEEETWELVVEKARQFVDSMGDKVGESAVAEAWKLGEGIVAA
jgi:hypothetical protein